MKTKIIYYSYSGNTKKVAQVLEEYLKAKGQVESVELNALDESKSFFQQCRRASLRIKAKLGPLNCDLSGADLICLGTPVWAFAPTPAMNAFLEQCSGLNAKTVILFTTSGGRGDERCHKMMQEALAQKGASVFKAFSVPRSKVANKDFILAKIKALEPL